VVGVKKIKKSSSFFIFVSDNLSLPDTGGSGDLATIYCIGEQVGRVSNGVFGVFGGDFSHKKAIGG
jgi:hypothetical protein